MSEIEDLKKEVQALKDQINPPPRKPFQMPRRDLTEGASMPANALRAMVEAVPESVMADLRADARKPNPVEASSSVVRGTPSALPQKRGTGWRDEIPLSSPPGVALADKLMDHQDKLDREELIERELKLAKMGKGDAG